MQDERTRGSRAARIWATSSLAIVAANGTALAQEQSAGATTQLEPIIVGARLIEEPIQRIPFGISVQNTRSIEEGRIEDTVDLARVTPGLNQADFGVRNGNTPNIRGVGSFFPLSGDDASVALFIDGVPVANRSQNRELFDVERVEVLRGPQNTLYGRNAQAGAISVTSIRPSFDAQGGLGAEVGTDGYLRFSAFASGPFSENVAGRIALRYQEEDGDIPNDSAGGNQRGGELTDVSASMLWQGEATEARLNIRYGNYDETPVHILYTDLPDFPRAYQDFQPEYELETLGGGLTIEHDFDNGVRLMSLTGIQTYDSRFTADDSDGYVGQALTGLPPFFFDDPGANFRVLEDDDFQVSQELRLTKEYGDGGSWVAGLSFYSNDLELIATFNSPGVAIGEFDNDFDTRSYSAFGEITHPISERMRIIGGFRYTFEDKSYRTIYTDASGGLLGFDNFDEGDDTYELVTGRAAITYDVVETVTVFGSIARGGKTGGFQLGDLDVATGGAVSDYDNAITWTAEAGVRGTLMGDRLGFAASVFFNDTKDEHLQVFDISTFEFIIENADTETYGLELEANYQITPNWRLDGTLALLETEITGSADPTVQDGNDVPYAPAVSYSLGAEYQTDMALFGADGQFAARIGYAFTGKRKADLQNRIDLESYGVLDLRVGWSNARMDLYAFVENALDEDYIESAGLFGVGPDGTPVTASTPGQRRKIGVGANVRF